MPDLRPIDTFPPHLSAPSRGGLWLAAGLVVLLATLSFTAMPGDHWQGYLVAFVFSFFGFFRAEGLARRMAGIALTGISGGLCLQDFLIWWIHC